MASASSLSTIYKPSSLKQSNRILPPILSIRTASNQFEEGQQHLADASSSMLQQQPRASTNFPSQESLTTITPNMMGGPLRKVSFSNSLIRCSTSSLSTRSNNNNIRNGNFSHFEAHLSRAGSILKRGPYLSISRQRRESNLSEEDLTNDNNVNLRRGSKCLFSPMLSSGAESECESISGSRSIGGIPLAARRASKFVRRMSMAIPSLSTEPIPTAVCVGVLKKDMNVFSLLRDTQNITVCKGILF